MILRPRDRCPARGDRSPCPALAVVASDQSDDRADCGDPDWPEAAHPAAKEGDHVRVGSEWVLAFSFRTSYRIICISRADTSGVWPTTFRFAKPCAIPQRSVYHPDA